MSVSRPLHSNLSRRQLLRGAGGAALFAGLSGPVLAGAPWALSLSGSAERAHPKGRKPTLVVIFLRGGADGLNFVVPHGDPEYYRLRPGLAIPRPGEARGALDLGNGFGFHPGCAPLMPLMGEGVLAALHAVGHPDNTRSHFAEQDRWELAHPSSKAGTDLGTPGWLGRYLAEAKPRGPIRAIALGSRIPRSLRGKVTALALPGLDQLARSGGESDLAATLRALESAYGKGQGGDGLRGALSGSGHSTLEAMERLGKVAANPAKLKGAYPAGQFGQHMQEVARLVRADLGLEVIQAEINGFDTHQNQAQPFTQRMQALGQGLAALRTDLADRLDDVLVLTVSEFGRTARVNGTRGTDHGSGSCLIAMGGTVRAKNGAPRGVLGDWPTLAKEALRGERDLRVTTDIRNVYAEILTNFLGQPSTGKSLPGWTPAPVGLIPSAPAAPSGD